MIYITGDCHSDYNRFSTDAFPEQKEMTREDFVIVCGDFGLWDNDKTEKWWFKWLSQKRFTLLFVDGNHENFDRLFGGEFETVDFHGGKAHRIRENIYHLIRGYVFDLCGKKFFAFGGASSHDTEDGILREEDYPGRKAMLDDYNSRIKRGEKLRINHLSWWKEELPEEEEMEFGLKTLGEHGNKVDFIITHCCPQRIASLLAPYPPDRLTKYFDTICGVTEFSHWFFGHYHDNREIPAKYTLLYERLVRIETE